MLFISQISMSNDIRQCDTRCKELGSITRVSIPPAASYEDVIKKAKQQFCYHRMF